MIVIGLPIAAAGLWLIVLGGSWYYLSASIGLLLTEWFSLRADIMALWIYLAIYAATVIWALWEAGLTPWAQVSRLVAPTVMLILVLTTLGNLRASARRKKRGQTLVAAIWAVHRIRDLRFEKNPSRLRATDITSLNFRKSEFHAGRDKPNASRSRIVARFRNFTVASSW